MVHTRATRLKIITRNAVGTVDPDFAEEELAARKKQRVLQTSSPVTASGRPSQDVAAEALSEPVTVVAAAATTTKRKKAKSKLLQSSHTPETLQKLQLKAAKIYNQLMEQYENPPCPLDHKNAFQLLCSVILSAQATDKKVNEIVPPLYSVAPDAKSMSKLEVAVIEDHIRKIGLAPTKAKNLSNMSKALVERHGGEVPSTFEELEALAGVGHKTASVVLAVAFQKPTFPVDTHIYRLGLRWGLTSGKSVEQAEADFKVCWPEDQWNALHLRLIYFGREHCPAQRHDPSSCSICSWAAVPPYNTAGHSPARAGGPRLHS